MATVGSSLCAEEQTQTVPKAPSPLVCRQPLAVFEVDDEGAFSFGVSATPDVVDRIQMERESRKSGGAQN